MKTLKETAADFQAKQDKQTLKIMAQCKTKTEAADKLGISRQALRMRLLRIEVNASKVQA